jgi:uncharacterized membrane protein
MSTKTQAKPLFAATLTPHRSLTPVGKRVLIALVVVLPVVTAALYTFVAFWASVTFAFTDLVAIWLTVAISSRRGRMLEELTLWPAALELRKVDAKGTEELLRFEPQTVRFVIDRDYNERVTGLWLREQTRKIPFGTFLSPDEMLSLSKVFGTALRKARS